MPPKDLVRDRGDAQRIKGMLHVVGQHQILGEILKPRSLFFVLLLSKWDWCEGHEASEE